ncbi:hypothetical protein LZC95_32745 [Pendulispora brunnea]|uniref:Uncharacterized protein n=1 Tax=Pendulispora brunnea TaxID=2905690 RepID=A0ABZ2JXH9_9BACT
MYIARWDWQIGIAVWWFEGISTDAEWEETFGHRRDLCVHSPSMPFRPAVLLYLDCDRPNALRRKQLADLSDHPNYNPYIACVAKTEELRGAQLALRWAGSHPNYDKEIFRDVEPALAWLEMKRGTHLAPLRLMVRDVRRLALRANVPRPTRD